MKKFIKLIKQIAFVVGVICIALSSCSKMNDLHNEYLEGEIIYAAKVDSAGVRSGKNRAILDLTINSQRIETIRIYWNDYADSLDVAINNRVGKFPVLLNNLEERDYVFYIVSFDKFGNRSLPFEVSGSVYGDRMLNSLTNRAILSITLIDGSTVVDWGSAPENSLYTELSYIGIDNKSNVLQISNSEISTSLTNCLSVDSSRTVFLPSVNVLDTLYLEWKVAPKTWVKLNKTSWTIAAYSDQQDDRPSWKIIDGDYSNDSYWHSAWSNYTAYPPHWIIIDMKQQMTVARIVTQRYSNTDANTIQYFIGDTPDVDADSWLQITEGNFSSSSPGGILDLYVDNPDAAVGRYLKLVLPDSNRYPYTALCEIDVYSVYIKK
jgi:hypothetical protein